MALRAICTKREDVAYWREILEEILPKKLAVHTRDPHAGYDTKKLLGMAIYVLGRAEDPAALEGLLAANYKKDLHACKTYVNILKKSDPGAALRVADQGNAIFADTGLKKSILGMYEKEDPRYHDMLADIFIDTNEWKYYDRLKKMSGDWRADLKSIVRRLRKEGRVYTIIDIMIREKRTDEAVAEAIATNDLGVIERYHKSLCPKHPDKYYDTYKKILTLRCGIGDTRSSYKRFAGHLRMMKSVPGHKREFAEFVGLVRYMYGYRPAFLDEIKDI